MQDAERITRQFRNGSGRIDLPRGFRCLEDDCVVEHDLREVDNERKLRPLRARSVYGATRDCSRIPMAVHAVLRINR